MVGNESGQANPDRFGHPPGLTVLATTYMWDRLAFWGTQTILLLYMSKYLLLPEHARQVAGLGIVRGSIEAVTGPLSDIAFASQIYGLFSGLIYLAPLAGAWLGDRLLGRTRTVVLGAILMTAGHFGLASETLFFVALLLLIMGSACMLGNMAAQVGLLYDAQDLRRTRAFGVYVIASNVGAMIAPLLIGTLGEQVDWRWGFVAAGCSMALGTLVYLAGLRKLPADQPRAVAVQMVKHKLTAAEWRRICVILLLLFAPFMLYTIALQQAYALMYVWADSQVDRHMFGAEIPVTWIGIFDGLMTIVSIWIVGKILLAMAKRGKVIGDLTMFGFGMIGIAAAWLLAAASATLAMTPLALWLAFFVIFDFFVGGFVEPQVLSIVSRDSPQSVVSTMMAMHKAAIAVAYFALGWLGRYYEPLGPSGFWLLTAGIAAISAVMVLVPHRWWVRELGPAEQALDH